MLFAISFSVLVSVFNFLSASFSCRPTEINRSNISCSFCGACGWYFNSGIIVAQRCDVEYISNVVDELLTVSNDVIVQGGLVRQKTGTGRTH